MLIAVSVVFLHREKGKYNTRNWKRLYSSLAFVTVKYVLLNKIVMSYNYIYIYIYIVEEGLDGHILRSAYMALNTLQQDWLL